MVAQEDRAMKCGFAAVVRGKRKDKLMCICDLEWFSLERRSSLTTFSSKMQVDR